MRRNAGPLIRRDGPGSRFREGFALRVAMLSCGFETALRFAEKPLAMFGDVRLRLLQLAPRKCPFCPLDEVIDIQLARFAAAIADDAFSGVSVLLCPVHGFGNSPVWATEEQVVTGESGDVCRRRRIAELLPSAVNVLPNFGLGT